MFPFSLDLKMFNFSNILQKQGCLLTHLSMTWSPSQSTSSMFSIVQLEHYCPPCLRKKNSLYLEITNRPSTYAKVLCEHGWTSQVFFCRTGQLRVTSKIVQLVVTDRENVCTTRLRAAILQDFGLKCCVRLAKPWDCIVWNNKWSRHTWVEYHIKDGYFHCDGRQKIATITITMEKKDISASCL